MKKVVIYTGDLCVHCDWAIDLLNRKKIKFTEYNVAKDSSKGALMSFNFLLSGSTHSSFS